MVCVSTSLSSINVIFLPKSPFFFFFSDLRLGVYPHLISSRVLGVSGGGCNAPLICWEMSMHDDGLVKILIFLACVKSVE